MNMIMEQSQTYSAHDAAFMIGCTIGALGHWQNRHDWPPHLPRKVGIGKHTRYTMDEIKAVRAWNPSGKDLGPEAYSCYE